MFSWSKLGQKNNQLLSELNAGIDPTKFGSWAKNNPNFWPNYLFQLCVYQKNCYEYSGNKLAN